MPKHPSEKDRPKYLSDLLAKGSEKSSYAVVADELEAAMLDLKQQVISRLLPALKEEVAGMPHEKYAQKLDIVRQINSELKRFDLAITSKNFIGVATLSADAGGKGGEGRFRLKGKETGKNGEPQNFHTQSLSELLSEIIVIDAPPRREALSELRQKKQKSTDGASRS